MNWLKFWRRWILSGHLPQLRFSITSDFDRIDLRIQLAWYFAPDALNQRGGPWVIEQAYGGAIYG